MREEFKVLRQYAWEMQDDINMTRERLKQIRHQIILCKDLGNLNKEEKRVLEKAGELWANKSIETELKSTFLEEKGKPREEFEILKDMLEIMRKPLPIPDQEMKIIQKQINECGKIASSTPQKNLVETAKTLWLDRKREAQEKWLRKRRKKYEFTAEDRKDLRKLRISAEVGPSETPKTTALVKRTIEVTEEDRKILKKWGFKW